MNYTKYLFVAIAACLYTQMTAQSKTEYLQYLVNHKVSSIPLQTDESHFLQGYKYYVNGQDTKALFHLEQALNLDPDQPAYLFYAGHCQYYLGFMKEAFERMEASVNQEYNQHFIELLGDLYLETNQLEKALNLYKNQLTRDHYQPQIKAFIAEILSFMGKTDEALEMYQEAVKQLDFYSDMQATCYFNIANLYFQNKQFSESIRWFEQYLNLRPLDAEAISLLVQANNKTGQIDFNQYLHHRIKLAKSLKLIPTDMEMYCIDKFEFGRYVLVAYKSLTLEIADRPVGYIFYVSDSDNQTIATLQTEFRSTQPDPAKFVLTRTDTAGHKTYPVVFPEKIDYAQLKATLAKLMESGAVSF